jgi:hypothetical protein
VPHRGSKNISCIFQVHNTQFRCLEMFLWYADSRGASALRAVPKQSHPIPKTRQKAQTMSLKANLCSYLTISTSINMSGNNSKHSSNFVFETYLHPCLFTFYIYCIPSYLMAIVFFLIFIFCSSHWKNSRVGDWRPAPLPSRFLKGDTGASLVLVVTCC